MTYFCFLHSSDETATYMQPLEAATAGDALEETQALLREHQSQVAARIYFGDTLIASFRMDRYE
ncbi:MAG: hypothetical protein ACRED4_09075 [Brevundimonas sp.]